MPSTIQFGSSGTDVKTAQTKLNQKLTPSPGLVIDGIFGNLTNKATRSFQSRKGLAVDGIIGPITWEALLATNGGGGGRPGNGGGNQPNPGNGNGGGGGTQPDPGKGGNTGGASTLISLARPVPHFWQGDVRWGGRTLGNKATIAGAGCCLTMVSMALNGFGRNVDPKVLDEWLDQEEARNGEGYLGDGLYWNTALRCKESEARSGLALSAWNQKSNLKETIKSRVNRNMPTFVHVVYPGCSSAGHWVLAVGYNAAGNIIMNDPGQSKGNGFSNPSDPQNVIETYSKNYTIDLINTF